MVKDFKLVLRIKYFNYFFLFCVGRVRRGNRSDCLLWWQGYLWYAFRYGLGGERAFWNKAGEEKS